MNPAYHTLIEAATLAPSGDNMQPWRFFVDEDLGEITVAVDPTRDLSPMNAGQRMARIAVGAAAENLCRTAQHNGWHSQLINCADQRLTLRVAGTDGAGLIDDGILRRVTNRDRYDAREFPRRCLEQLEQLHTPHVSIRTRWIIDRGSINALATAIGQADSIMFGNPEVFRAFLANVRFGVPSTPSALDGLPVGTLGLSLFDHFALRCALKSPDCLLSSRVMRRTFYVKASQLVRSSSGICIILAGDRSKTTDYLVGRAFQRAWLALTDLGLSAQPMMSIPVLENFLDFGINMRSSLSATEVSEMIGHLVGTASTTMRCAALLRFGFAPVPPARAGRLPIESVVELRQAGTRTAAAAAQPDGLQDAGGDKIA